MSISGQIQSGFWPQGVKMETLSSSYLHRGGDEPLLGTTIWEHFASVTAAHGDREAVVSLHQRRRLSYAELLSEVNRLAQGDMVAEFTETVLRQPGLSARIGEIVVLQVQGETVDELGVQVTMERGVFAAVEGRTELRQWLCRCGADRWSQDEGYHMFPAPGV